MKHWRVEQIAWDRFTPEQVDPRVVPLVKAAAMVERPCGRARHLVEAGLRPWLRLGP